ncbi:MAG: hypothetical protein ACT4O3_03010 [Elusimicrobiota bacterium]
MMSPGANDKKKDGQLVSNVRVQLVRRWIDTSRLDVYVEKGSVEIHGSLVFSNMVSPTEAEFAREIRGVETAVRTVHGVRDLHWKLANWEKVGLRWKKKRGGGPG